MDPVLAGKLAWSALGLSVSRSCYQVVKSSERPCLIIRFFMWAYLLLAVAVWIVGRGL